MCLCGVPARIGVSHTASNPGREFASCANKEYICRNWVGGCKFFVWVDEEYESDFVVSDSDEEALEMVSDSDEDGSAGPATATFMPTHISAELFKRATECPICITNIKRADFAVTGCGHKFCRACITAQLAIKRECPVCRTSLKA